jgi:hypothetical protein
MRTKDEILHMFNLLVQRTGVFLNIIQHLPIYLKEVRR